MFLRRDPQRQMFLREVHPEVLFWALNSRQPVASKKKRAQGRNDRLAVLEKHWPEVQEIYQREKPGLSAKGATGDDLIDALAAVTAWRACGGRLATLPRTPETDDAGLRMEILYPALYPARV